MFNLLKPFHRPLALALALLMALTGPHCYYRRVPLNQNRLPRLDTAGKTFYAVDLTAKNQGTVWQLYRLQVGKTELSAGMRMLGPEDAQYELDRGTKKERSARRQHVLLYLKPDFAATLPDSAELKNIPLDQLEKIEVYENDDLATVAIITGAAVGAFFLLVLIALATKSSCPFVYAENPDGTWFEGELYSGATYPQLERHDWLPMPRLRPQADGYHVLLANRAKEIQHTNLLELVAVDHPAGAEVLYDRFGRLHTLTAPQPPLQAQAQDGRDLRAAMSAVDTAAFQSLPQSSSDERARESVTLTFAKPAGATSARLAIHAKNTFWLDYAYGLFLDEFGEYAPRMRSTYLEKSAEDLRQWSEDQQIPLAVWLETAEGKWEKTGYFNIAGPMALKKDVLELDLSRVPGDRVRVRLESGFQFWEIDWVALDFSAPQPVAVQTLAPMSAWSPDGHDHAGALRGDDDRYYTQPQVGDQAEVVFPLLPPPPPGQARSLLLHAKGHYEILRDPVAGKPNLLYLRQFQKPDAFPLYTRDRWQELLALSETATQNPEPRTPN
jgi:hypothetical protein